LLSGRGTRKKKEIGLVKEERKGKEKGGLLNSLSTTLISPESKEGGNSKEVMKREMAVKRGERRKIKRGTCKRELPVS